ncbi:MAG TPA: YkgJ family cysteine cluster protein [Desulfohalobiaceae bacterium]|nr:YkgJ family cysteine cluster protein [Desulfohalobiaceae bacterium]
MKSHKKAFKCQMCGYCCYGEGGIVVSKKDQKRLSLYLNLSFQTFRDKYTVLKGNQYVLQTSENGYCVFFHPDKGCFVHSHKPDICLAWPFFRGNLQDQSSWQMAKEFCPGISSEVDHKEFVRQGLLYLKENNLFQDQLDKDIPQALLKKQEADLLDSLI